MKALITIAIVLGLYFAGRGLYRSYDEITRKQRGEKPAVAAAPVVMPGLPERMEPFLADAQRQGPQAFKTFLDKYRASIRDPRLGDLELDYVIAISRTNPAEARRVFAEVQARTPPSSPLYTRVKRLSATYQ